MYNDEGQHFQLKMSEEIITGNQDWQINCAFMGEKNSGAYNPLDGRIAPK